MTRTTGWVVAISAAIATITLIVGIAVAIFVADLFGKVANDRACMSALDGLRAERAVGTTGPELHTLEVIADRYCSEVGT